MPQAPSNSSPMLDPNGVSFIPHVVDSAIAEAKLLGIVLPADLEEARGLLTKRVLKSIERGETDMLKLRDIALSRPEAGGLTGPEDLLPISLLSPI